MKLLIDASALLNIIRLKGADAVEYLKGGYILPLTPYEVGNGVWKEALLLGRISLEEALLLISHICKVYTMLRYVEPSSWVDVLRLAHRLGITYYDAAYVVAAAENGLTLVTDDKKLLRRVQDREGEVEEVLGRPVRVVSTAELEHLA